MKKTIGILLLTTVFTTVSCNSPGLKRLLIATGLGCGAGLALGAIADELKRKKSAKERRKVENRMLGILRKKKANNKGKVVGLAAGCMAGLGVGAYMNWMHEDIKENFGSRGIDLDKVPGPDGETDALRVKMDGNITFVANKTSLNSTGSANLAKLSEALGSYPDAKIRITGHTSGRYDPAANIKLSQGRADTAKDILVSNGVSSGRVLSTIGKGYAQPLAGTTQTDPANRRVEIMIVGD